MNARCFKTVFSERLGCMVAVGEHACSQGKSSGESSPSLAVCSKALVSGLEGFVGVLVLSMAWVGLAWAQPVVNALPNAGQVVRGAASMVQSTHQLSINQTSQRAAINWQSFDIGAGAKVNVIQPNAQAVLLNRVIGQNPSQIFGQLQANGQVILVNPNGVLFGKDGSVNAGGFTASTLGITDANFMAGNMVYERNGSTAGVVNRGSIQVMPGGYVALLGASVSNEGKIIASQGGVAMGAAETIKVPVSGSGRIKLELSAADINASVSNAGQIVAEGGQVYLQALALNRAAAQVIQSGSIDTSGEQAGQVHLLADGGAITVGGSIMANSSGTNNKGQTHKGGDIVIGRDEDTGVLARYTDVSGANLESKQGFVETSGEFLKSNGVQIKAGQWLLDPTDITIVSADTAAANTPKTTASSTDTYQQTGATNTSEILNTDISAALSNGTNVVIKTTNASATGNGDITVAANISATSATAQDATLTLQAERDIVVDSNVSIARTGSNKLNVILNSDLDGNGTGAIVMNTGSSISSNGGNIALGGGTAGDGSDYARGYSEPTRHTGLTLSGATITASGGHISIKGKGNATFTNTSNMRGVDMTGTAISTTGSGNITVDGVGGNANVSATNVGIGITGASTVTGSSGGTVTLTGTAINGALYNFGVWVSGAGSKVTSAGHVTITGTSGAAVSGQSYNDGVMIQNYAEVSTTGTGNLSISGTGATSSGTYNQGVNLAGSSTVSTASGTLSITGVTGTQGGSSFGVAVGSGTQVTTSSGDISITGTSRISGRYGYGFWLGDNLTKIRAGGNGNITINGTGSDMGSGDALGMQIRTAGSITTNNGNISLTGTSRGAAGNNNIGIGFNSGGSVVAGGSGSVSLTGTGGSTGTWSSGVSNALVTTSGGTINITGASSSTGASSEDISTIVGLTSVGGNITLTSNSYAGSGTETIDAGAGTVSLRNRTAGTLINLGGADVLGNSATRTLGLSDAELDRITASSLVIGQAGVNASGDVTVSASVSPALASNFNVLSGGNITLNANSAITTLTNGNVLLNSDSDGSGSGAIAMSAGSSIVTNGGGITLGGGVTGDGAGNAIGNSTSIHGISLTGASLNAGGGNIALRGQGGAVTTSVADVGATGIYMVGGGDITTSGSGSISMTGAGGGTGGSSQSIGVRITGDVGNISTVTGGETGSVTIEGTGTSSATGNNEHGVMLGHATVTSTGGHVSVTGTGGSSGTGGSNKGVSLESGAEISATGAGTVTVTGTGGTGTGTNPAANNNLGLGLNVGTTIKSASGAIYINARAPDNGSYATALAGTVSSTNNADITITTDSVSLTGLVATTAGKVTVQNMVAGTLINVGGSGTDVRNTSPKTMVIDATELGKITAATTVVGRHDGSGSDSGNVTVSALNMGALGNTGGNLTVLSGNNIAINGAITKSTGTDATLTLNAVNGIDITNAAASVGGTVAGAGKLNVAMTANGNAATVANSSGLVLTKTINANGGTVTLSGTNKQNAGGSGNSGVRFTGASIYAGSLTVTGNQTGANTISDTNGIHFSGTNVFQTTSGTSTLTGNSNAIGNLGAGIFFADSSSSTLDSGTGSIDFSGLNSNTGYRGIRIGGSNLAFINAKGNITFEDTQTQVFLRGQLTQQANTTVNFKGKSVSMYAGASVVKAAGATGTTLNLEAQTVVVGESGNAALTADTINLTGNTTTAGATGVQISNASTLTSSGATTITASGPGTSLNAVSTTTIAATGGLTVNINNAGTLASLLTGGTANAGGLTKQGAGTLTVGNTNTHQGTTLVSAGTLQLNNVNALQNSTLDTGTSGTQQVTFGVASTNTYNLGGLQGADALAIGANTISVGANNSSTTYSGVLSGTGDLTKVGTGNLTLSGQSTKTGNYNANNGTLTLTGASNTYRELSGVNVNINNGATVAVPNITQGGFISSNVVWTFGSSGGGTLNIDANFVNRGTNGNKFVTTGGATNTINGNINLDFATNLAGPTFDVAEGAGGVAGLIHAGSSSNGSATQGFIKNGAGTLQLSGANNYKGPVTINAGTVELTGAGTLGSSVASMAIANAGIFKSSSTAAQTIAGIITGQGSVIQAGTGTMTLSGNNTYSGGTTINSGSTLNVGSGGAVGSLGTGAVLDNGLLTFNRSNSLTVANVISGSGALTQAGAGTTILTADNSYAGTTTISAGTLQVGNGGSTGTLGSGDVAMSNNANLSFSRAAATTIGNSISGAGNVSAAITGASSTLTVSNPINLTNGTVNLATDSHLSVTAAISTTNTSDSAVILNAGASTSAGTSTGGNLAFTGGGNVTVGAGGRATLMTGSISDSTGLTSLVGSGSGRFRYNSDETNPNYTTALGAGLNAIYREAPTLTATLNNAVKTYDGLTYSGGNGLGALTGYANGDAAALLGSVTYGGAAQSAKNVGSYLLSGTVASGAGYLVTLNNATLTVNKADLVLSGTRAYDGSQTFAGQFLTATGVNNESFALTGSGHSSNLGTKNVQTQQVLSSLTGLSLGASNGTNSALSSNYNAISTTGSSVSVTRKDATVTGTATQVTYNGNLQNQQAATSSGFVSGDSISITGLASGKNAATYASNLGVTGTDAANYNITFANADLVIGKANLVLSGTREYDASKTFAGSFLTATGVGGESFAITGAGDASNLSSKNVQTNQLLASLTGLSLGASNGSNAGVSSNYNAISTTGSSVSVTAKAATVDATATSVTYNGAVQNQTAPTSSGFIAGDAITISGAASGQNAGTYGSNLVVSGADAGNYAVTRNDANLVIQKAALTATGNSSSVTYNGGSQSVSGFTVSGLQGNDTVASLSHVVASGASGTNAGSYTNTVTAGLETNYAVSTVNGSLQIAKAALTATGQSSTVTYNGVNQSVTGFTVSGLQGSDTIDTLSSIAAEGATAKNAGTYTNTVTAGSETNYTVTTVNGTLQIDKANLIATGNSSSVTYNAANQSVSGFTVSGLKGSDAISNLSSISAAGATAKDVGSYTNTVTAGTETNYNVSTVNGSLQIGKANLVLSGTREYDASKTFAGSFLTATGVGGESFAITGAGDASNLSSKNVQTNQLLASLTGLSLGASNGSNAGVSSNYNAISTTGSSVSVTAKAATVTGTATNVTYNGSSQTQSAASSTGFIAGDAISFSGAAAGKNAGTYTSNLFVGGTDATNYSVTVNNADLVIAKAALTVTASQVSKTYDGGLGASGTGTVGALAGAAAGDLVNSAGTQVFLDKNAGTGKTVRASGVTIKDASNADMGGNYHITYVDNTTSSISKAALTVTANSDARFVTQTDATGFNGVSYSGFVGGETSSVLGGTLAISRTNAPATQGAGSYSGVLQASGLSSGNYEISYANGNYTIVPANQLLIKTNNTSVTYGSLPTFNTTAQYLLDDGVHPSQVVTLTRTGSGGAYSFNDGAGGSVSMTLKPYVMDTVTQAATSTSQHTVVGNYDIKDHSPTVVGSNFVGSPVFVGALTVDTKAVTPNATGVSKVYDATTSMNNVVIGLTGKVTADELNISGAGAFSQRHVGSGLSYTVSGIALDGADAANYHLSGGSTSLTGSDGVITAAELKITTSDVSKTYDRSLSAQGSAQATGGTQLFGSDSLSGGSFAFTNWNAGAGNKVVTVADVTLNDGNGGLNYVVTYVDNTTSTITPKSLMASYSAANKTYNGNRTVSVTGSSSDVISGDTVNFSNTSANFDTKNVGVGKTVSISGISISGADSGNYSLQSTNASSTADISVKNLTASFTASSKTYDGNLVANVAGSSSDIVGSDAITFTTTGAHFDTKDAGTGKVVSVAGIGLSGADAANYSLQNTSASTTGTITPKDVSITSLSASDKVYDGSRAATIASGVISTGVGSETLLISGHGTFSDKHAGTDKTVTVDDVTTLTKSDGTGNWNNYKLVSTGSMTTSADITQAALTVTANAVTKTYDSTLTASGAGTAGALAGAGDVVNNVGQQAFLDKNAGTGKTVRASGVTIKDASNADMTGNYLITYVDNTTSVIQQAALELSTSNVVKTYDGLLTANGTATVNSGTLFSGDNLSGGSFAFTDKNQGQGNKTVTVSGVTVGDGTHNDNYAVTYTANTTSTIQKAALTVTANAEVKTYDGTLSASGTATVGALAGSGDAVNSAGSQAFLNKNAGSSKTVRAAGVTIKDANNVDMSGNYVITYVNNTTSTINKAQLSAALVGTIQKEYDGTTATASDLTNANYALSGWASVAGVSEGASVNQKAATYANANVANNRGTGAVTATLGPAHFTADAGTDLGNYLLPTSASGNVGLITPAALTVKVNNTAMFVTQDPNSAFDQGFGFVGLKNGESGVNVVGTLTRSYSGAANPATGSYTSVYGLTAAPTADNYTVTVQKGDLTVVAADKLLINVGGKSESYGALTAANAGASANTVVAQYCLVSSDCNGANLANLTMTRQGGLWTATDVSNSTVRFNTVVDTAGHISGGGYLNAGSYAYAVDGLTTSGAVNFNGTAVSGGSLTVEAQRLTLSASNVSKVYDGTNALDAMALTPAGVLSGDTVGVRSSGGSFGSKNAGAQSFSLTGLQLQGSDRANYFFAGQSLSGTGTITPKALSVAASAVDKVYDGTTAANGSLSALNVIGQDEVLLSWGPVQFASKNVSRDAQGQVQAQAVNFDGVQLSGVDAGNYSVSPTASSNAKITPKLLSVNGTRVANKTQDGDTETSVQLGLLSGLVGTEALQMQAAANFESSDVGINKPVNVRYTLANGANDGLSGNYELPVQRLSANIFAKSGGNVVQPIVIPTNANKATSRVVASKGAGALARFGAATVSANQSENADVCSVATPESCLCQQTGLAGVEICFPGHPKPQPALLEKGN